VERRVEARDRGYARQLSADELERRSGLAGLAGTGDMKVVLEAEEAGDEGAALAVEVYLHRLRREIGAMAAALDGVDALVFTGGVGERSAAIRRRACEGLGFLGVEIDPALNAALALDEEISSAGATARTFVVAAREDIEIARGVRSALALE